MHWYRSLLLYFHDIMRRNLPLQPRIMNAKIGEGYHRSSLCYGNIAKDHPFPACGSEQWFSTEDDFVPQETLEMSEDKIGCHECGRGLLLSFRG